MLDLLAASSNIIMVVVLVVLFAGVFLFPMITGRKRGKNINDMRTTLRLGDEIMTIGGIVGKVVEIIETSPVDKDFVIETGTGDKKSTMIFDIRALHENRTRMKELAAEAAAHAEQQRLEREAKNAREELPAPKEAAEEAPQQAEEKEEKKD